MPKEISENRERSFCSGNCEIRKIDESERTVELSFSSDDPYLRPWGYEVLSHDPSAVDMSRIKNSAALLAEHDRAKQIGVVESAWLDGKKGRAVVRFSNNSQLAKEYFDDVKDGIRKNISVGYAVYDDEKTDTKDGEDVWTVTRWMPFEISVVSVPADSTVGVGRSKKQEDQMPKELENKTEGQKSSEPQKVDLAAITAEAKKNARTEEEARIKEINSIGTQFGVSDIAIKAIEDGSNVDAFRAEVLESFKGNAGKQVKSDAGFIGLSDDEVKKYDFMRAIRALANPNDRRAQDEAGYEFEISQEAQRMSGVKAQGILIPFDALSRDMTVVAGSGGNVVANELMAGNFIGILRNRSAVMQSATIMTGLVGNIPIPRQTSVSSIGDLAEAGTTPSADIEFDQITMSPKRAGGTVPYSKQLLAQSSLDIEMLIKNDLLSQIGLKIDYNALNGDGTSSTPVGIRNSTGVNVLPLGTNGLAPKWSDFVELETMISEDNADISTMMYLLNSRGRGYVKTKEKVSGYPQFIAGENGMINGYGYRVSNQVPKNLTKGTGTNLSNITFGNFADLVIGFWGGIDLVIDQYTRKKEGMIEITADQFYDTVVRRAESFAVIEDAII